MTSEQYPNQPLIEVIFEMRFPGNPAVECRRDEFYRAVRDKYPKLFVPKLKEGQAPALAMYSFKTEDDKASVMTAVNKLAFSTHSYSGFESFKEEALRIVALFSRTFQIEKLNRTGLRYINAIPFIPAAGTIPISSYLKLGVLLPEPYTDKFKTMNLTFASPVEDGTINARIEHVIAEDKSHEAILLDLDYAMEEDLHIGMIESYLEKSHAVTKQMFEGILTDEYRAYMRGEVI